jgi:hypothetical protein
MGCLREMRSLTARRVRALAAENTADYRGAVFIRPVTLVRSIPAASHLS